MAIRRPPSADSFTEDCPGPDCGRIPATRSQSVEYGYGRLVAHNATHLEYASFEPAFHPCLLHFRLFQSKTALISLNCPDPSGTFNSETQIPLLWTISSSFKKITALSLLPMPLLHSWLAHSQILNESESIERAMSVWRNFCVSLTHSVSDDYRRIKIMRIYCSRN